MDIQPVQKEYRVIRHMPGELRAEMIEEFIARVHREYFPTLQLDYDVSDYSKKLAEKAWAVIAYEKDDEKTIVGGALGYCNDLQTEMAYLSFFAKIKDSPKGLATRLHGEFLRLVQEAGMKSIALEVRKTNEHALEFYERNGYVCQEDHGSRFLYARSIGEIK